jgi:hypothetical protein
VLQSRRRTTEPVASLERLGQRGKYPNSRSYLLLDLIALRVSGTSHGPS